MFVKVVKTTPQTTRLPTVPIGHNFNNFILLFFPFVVLHIEVYLLKYLITAVLSTTYISDLQNVFST